MNATWELKKTTEVRVFVFVFLIKYRNIKKNPPLAGGFNILSPVKPFPELLANQFASIY